MTRAIDCLVNVDFADRPMPEFMTRVKEDYFKGGGSFFASPELGELVDDMDAHGVEKAILIARVGDVEGRALRFVEARPDRFSLGVGGLDLLRPMEALRRSCRRSSSTTRWPTRSVGPELLGRRHVPAHRRRLLPPLREVLRARPAAVHQHRHPRAAPAGRAAEPDPPRPGLLPVPGAEAVDDPRRGPVVGRRHPADAQVPEPAADDLGLVARSACPRSCCTSCAPAARTGSCSPATTRSCRSSAASARPRRSTCPTRSATPGCTATPTPSSSAGAEPP